MPAICQQLEISEALHIATLCQGVPLELAAELIAQYGATERKQGRLDQTAEISSRLQRITGGAIHE